ncbi:MAG: hypothetical protein ACI87E_000339 [Mariniblastus sp.]|jgi:hypothetical protein
MKHWITTIAIAATSLSTFGCSMCCGPYDYDYPNYGGLEERVHPDYGRVGSIFSDPNAGYGGPSSDSNLTPHPEARGNRQRAQDLEDMNDIRQGIDQEIEAMAPGTQPAEELPSPSLDDTTASRMFQKQPLRSTQKWR